MSGLLSISAEVSVTLSIINLPAGFGERFPVIISRVDAGEDVAPVERLWPSQSLLADGGEGKDLLTACELYGRPMHRNTRYT